MEKGKIKWFDETKGFGFIVPETQGQSDIFFHRNHSPALAKLSKKTAENAPVTYTVTDLKKGKKAEAIDVELV